MTDDRSIRIPQNIKGDEGVMEEIAFESSF